MNPHDYRKYLEGLVEGEQRRAGMLDPPPPRHPTGLTAGEPFKDKAAQVEAMRDPRYATDPAFRQSVAERTLGTLQARTRFG